MAKKKNNKITKGKKRKKKITTLLLIIGISIISTGCDGKTAKEKEAREKFYENRAYTNPDDNVPLP